MTVSNYFVIGSGMEVRVDHWYMWELRYEGLEWIGLFCGYVIRSVGWWVGFGWDGKGRVDEGRGRVVQALCETTPKSVRRCRNQKRVRIWLINI